MDKLRHEVGEENAGYLRKKVKKSVNNDSRQPLHELSQNTNIVDQLQDLAVNEKHCEPPKKPSEPAKKKRFSSGNLEDFLSFEPTERPKWREDTITRDVNSIPSVSEMIRDIVGYKHTYEKLKKSTERTDRKHALKYLLTKFLCNVQKEEDIGVKEEGKTDGIMQILDREFDDDDYDETGIKRRLSDCSEDTFKEKKLCVEEERNESPEFDTYPSLEEEIVVCHGRISGSDDVKPSKSEIETQNLYKAYRHIIEELNKAKYDTFTASDTRTDIEIDCNLTNVFVDYKGIIDLDSLIIHTHRILMQDVMKEGQIPGRFSTKKRKADFKGKEYWYPTFEDERFADKAIQTLVDKVNDIMDNIKHKNVSDEEKVKLFFKCSSLFLFGFLTLHPFADGNGRLARLLASYNLRTFSPFMTPIYNVFSSSRECDYVQALVDTREGLQFPTKITAVDEAVKLTISVMRQKPQDLCAMLIESNWTMWRQFLHRLGDRSNELFDWEIKNQQFLNRTFETTGSVE